MDKSNILRVAKNEYVKWIRNPKMIILAVMLIFAYDYVILELTEAAGKMGEKLQVFEGFIGISNSQLLLMIIPIVFVGLMGDFPKVDGNAMFYIHRAGKNNWLLGQILFAGFICRIRLVGIVAVTGILCLGNVLAYMENGIRWIFPTAHAVLEIHFDELYKEPVMDLRMSYLYYIILIVLFFIVAYLKIEHYDFSGIEEMEE